MSGTRDVRSTNTENKRIQYIDIAKTLGIIFVIAGHVVSSDTEIKKVIYSFHMPLFFMLSGMLVKVKKQYNALTRRNLIEKKFKSLMIPYVIWALIYASFSIKHLLFVLYGTRETLIKAESLSSLWFLPVMFIAFMIVELVLQASIKSKKGIVIGTGIVGCFLIGMLFPHYAVLGDLWGIDIAFIAAAFMLIGMVIKQIVEAFSNTSRLIFATIILSVIFLVAVRFSNSSVGYVLMANAIYGNPVVFLINSVVGSALIITISCLLAAYMHRINAFSWIGARTLGIFVIHKPVVEFCRMAATRLGVSYDNLAAVVCITFVTLVVSGMIVIVVEGAMPEMIGLKTYRKEEGHE